MYQEPIMKKGTKEPKCFLLIFHFLSFHAYLIQLLWSLSFRLLFNSCCVSHIR
ncbi:hypothetical protein SODALDRAFT_348262, partial [Sodiomyces alkalinus F11]